MADIERTSKKRKNKGASHEVIPSYVKKGPKTMTNLAMGFGVGLPVGSARPESKGGVRGDVEEVLRFDRSGGFRVEVVLLVLFGKFGGFRAGLGRRGESPPLWGFRWVYGLWAALFCLCLHGAPPHRKL